MKRFKISCPDQLRDISGMMSDANAQDEVMKLYRSWNRQWRKNPDIGAYIEMRRDARLWYGKPRKELGRVHLYQARHYIATYRLKEVE